MFSMNNTILIKWYYWHYQHFRSNEILLIAVSFRGTLQTYYFKYVC